MAFGIKLNEHALNVITAIKYEADTINAFNKMTFLFDANWQGVGNTLPISFFYVKDFKEVMESEISQKPLLFYNSQNENNPNAVAGGLLGIVSDNIINKPKKYQMSILIPRTIDVYLRQSLFNRNFTTLASLFQGRKDGVILQSIDVVARIAVDLLTTLLSIMGLPNNMLTEQASSLSDYLSDYSWGVDDSNKASLDAMWENRTILKMKYWNGWKFKYVAIESYIPSKDGTEDGFYEATLNVTEVPIMTLRKESNVGKPAVSALTAYMASSKAKKINEFLDKLDNDMLK